jgi:hypothetical protein
MKNTKTNKLALRSQTIRDLTAAELKVANGGKENQNPSGGKASTVSVYKH